MKVWMKFIGIGVRRKMEVHNDTILVFEKSKYWVKTSEMETFNVFKDID